MTTAKLSHDEIKTALNQLDHWQIDPQNSYIYKEWQFNNFKTLVSFINQVFELADAQNHHPEILTTYKSLRIRIWTHDADGITQKDIKLASSIDYLMASNI